MKFKKKEYIELYIKQGIMAEGHFHKVQKCEQHRQIEEIVHPNGKREYREVSLQPSVWWAYKEVKKKEHIDEVPNDIAK